MSEQEIIHVLPLNDLRPHIESPHCPCRPRIEGEGCLIVHHAYDGRDRCEQSDSSLIFHI